MDFYILPEQSPYFGWFVSFSFFSPITFFFFLAIWLFFFLFYLSGIYSLPNEITRSLVWTFFGIRLLDSLICGILDLLNDGIEPGAQQWGCRVLTTGLPGNFWQIYVCLKPDTSIDNSTISEVFSDIGSMITFLWTHDSWWRSLHWALICPAVPPLVVYMLILLCHRPFKIHSTFLLTLICAFNFELRMEALVVDETWEPSFTCYQTLLL